MILAARKPSELLYLKIANNIEQQIKNEVLHIGDKIPSIRTICRDHGVSMSTALQAYFELEKKGMCALRIDDAGRTDGDCTGPPHHNAASRRA